MPGFIARRLCPELIFVPTDFKKYNYYSDLARKGKNFASSNSKCILYVKCLSFSIHLFVLLVFRRYDPNFLAASLDEAYLDITEVCKDRGLTSEQVITFYYLFTISFRTLVFKYLGFIL